MRFSIMCLVLCATVCAARADEAVLQKRPAAQNLAEQVADRVYLVNDALGAPIPGATVVVDVKPWPPPEGDNGADEKTLQTIRGVSDERGEVTIHKLRQGAVAANAQIRHPEYGVARFSVDVQGGTLRVPLVRRGSEAFERAITGQVVGSDGKPIAGAVIRSSEVRTPGSGLVEPVYPLGTGETDDEGRFAFYLPNTSRGRNRDRGELIPPNSRYSLTVTGPEGDDSFFPVAGRYANTEPVRIELVRPTRRYRLGFLASGGGLVTDPAELRQTFVTYDYDDRPGEGVSVTLDALSVSKGRKLLPGKYSAVRYANGKVIHYRPLILGDDPRALRYFQLAAYRTYSGRVVHGVTGAPLAGALVMATNGILHNNLALLTPDDWKKLHELPAAPDPELPAMKRLEEFYRVPALVRTDRDGRFELARETDQEFYSLLAFDEDFVPFHVRLGLLPAGDSERIDAGEFLLFPAAKVLVQPVFQPTEGRHLSVSPLWMPTATDQPEWIDSFQTILKKSDRGFEYVHWLKLNEMQPIFVPADVRLQMRFECPYNDEWAPATIEAALELKQGAVRQLGKIHFIGSLPAVVRVVDARGNPVEGAPVRRMHNGARAWSVAHNTDKDGLAHFFIHPGTTGKFKVHEFAWTRSREIPANLVTDFAVGYEAPTKPHEIVLTDEQLRMLRGEAGKPQTVP